MNTSMNQASLVLLMSSPDPGKRDAAARALHGSTIDASAAASLVLLMSSPDPGKRDAAARALHGGTIDASAAASLVLLMSSPDPGKRDAAAMRCMAARSMHRLPRRWSC